MPIKLKNLVFEHASVLFNLAALYSQLSAAEDRSTTDGIKRAAANYQVRFLIYSSQSPHVPNPSLQQAAGTFAFLRSTVLPKLVYSPDDELLPMDLSNDFIKGLECLMLAQAQECSWQLAKLSTAASSLKFQPLIEQLRPIQKLFNSQNFCSCTSDAIEFVKFILTSL